MTKQFLQLNFKYFLELSSESKTHAGLLITYKIKILIEINIPMVSLAALQANLAKGCIWCLLNTIKSRYEHSHTFMESEFQVAYLWWHRQLGHLWKAEIYIASNSWNFVHHFSEVEKVAWGNIEYLLLAIGICWPNLEVHTCTVDWLVIVDYHWQLDCNQ